MTIRKKLKIRHFTKADYPTMIEMWRGWKTCDPPEYAMIPNIGYVAYDDDGIVAIEFVLMSNSNGIACKMFTTTNPERSPLVNARALRLIDKFMESQLNRDGYTVLYHLTGNPKLAYMNEARGFVTVSETETLQAKSIWEQD